MDLEHILRDLCAALPEALGAVLADADGESVVTVRGGAPLPPGADAEARRYLPRALEATVALDVFALRLAGAEPSAVLRMLAPRRVPGYEVRHRAMDVLVAAVDEELYLALFVRRPVFRARAHRAIERARQAIASCL